MNKRIWFCLLIAAALVLCGCSFRAAGEMYAVPMRPSEDYHLQDAINKAMSGLDYAAPKSGTNQQIVQTVDIDGNGDLEYLLFAKGDGDRHLQIFIFDKQKDSYNLVDTISCNGYAFDRVEYVQMDNRPGKEIVVSYYLNEQLTGGLCLYTFSAGNMEQVLSTAYSEFLITDLNNDSYSELFVVRPGPNQWGKGVAELYSIHNGSVERSMELNLVVPVSDVRRVVSGFLQDGTRCIYVTEKSSEMSLKTDIFALVQDSLINVSQFADISTTVETVGNFFVDPVDIDADGVLELPKLQDMVQVTQEGSTSHKIISWHALDIEGNSYNKAYTYHCFVDGWFVELESDWTQILTVSRQGKKVDFFSWDKQYGVPVRLFSIYVLTEQNREELADSEGSVRLLTTAGAIYVGEITSNGEEYGLTEEKLQESFHLIQQDS